VRCEWEFGFECDDACAGAALLESIELLTNATKIFTTRCVDGIVAKKEHCAELIEYSLAMVTGLNSKIGYDKAARSPSSARRQERPCAFCAWSG